MSLDELKRLPYPKLTRLWKEYVEEMRKALDQAAGDETTAAGKRVVSLIEELRMVLTCLMSANPLGMQSLRCALRSAVCSYLLASSQRQKLGFECLGWTLAAKRTCTCPLCSSWPTPSLSREDPVSQF